MVKHYFVALAAVLSLYSCCYPDDEPEQISIHQYGSYEPVYMSREALDTTVKLLPPQDISESGKIYIIGDLLFVGEQRQGFHIIDNSQPTNPVTINFLQVLGCTDVAVRENVLYLNQAVDLLTVRYDAKTKVLEVLKRNKNMFPEMASPEGHTAYVPQDSVIVDWKPINI